LIGVCLQKKQKRANQGKLSEGFRWAKGSVLAVPSFLCVEGWADWDLQDAGECGWNAILECVWESMLRGGGSD